MNRDPGPEDDEGLVGRWSRRKQQALAVGGNDATAASSTTSEDLPSPRELTDEDMPDPDSMDEDDDYSVFLSPGVSDQLRARALRRFFSAPRFNLRDGLDDYDDDFTALPGLGGMVTHEMRRMLEREIRQATQVQSDDTTRVAQEESGKAGPGDAQGSNEDVEDDGANGGAA